MTALPEGFHAGRPSSERHMAVQSSHPIPAPPSLFRYAEGVIVLADVSAVVRETHCISGFHDWQILFRSGGSLRVDTDLGRDLMWNYTTSGRVPR